MKALSQIEFSAAAPFSVFWRRLCGGIRRGLLAADQADGVVLFTGYPVNVVRKPVHDFQLTGFPSNGGGLFILGHFVVEGFDQLAVAENVAVCVPDGEVALGALADPVAACGNQGVVCIPRRSLL